MFLGTMFDVGRRVTAKLEQLLRGREHPIARALVTSRGARGSGPDGEWTRRDHRRALLAGCVLFVVGWAIALEVFHIADTHPSGTRWNSVLSGVGLFFFFGGGYIGWRGFKHTRGALRRASSVPTER